MDHKQFREEAEALVRKAGGNSKSLIASLLDLTIHMAQEMDVELMTLANSYINACMEHDIAAMLFGKAPARTTVDAVPSESPDQQKHDEVAKRLLDSLGGEA